MHWRLADAAGLDPGRLGRDVIGAPDVRPGEVVSPRGKPDVRDHARRPLGLEHRAQLRDGPGRGQAREPNADEGGVPGPLVRIEPGRRGDDGTEVVAAQHRCGRLADVLPRGHALGRGTPRLLHASNLRRQAVASRSGRGYGSAHSPRPIARSTPRLGGASSYGRSARTRSASESTSSAHAEQPARCAVRAGGAT